MKIWKAELILFYNKKDEYETHFSFELQNEDYEINDCTNDEWIYSEGWTCTRIPIKMIIENYNYGLLKVTQGFDHELNKDKLQQLENGMKKYMIVKLKSMKEDYLKQYEKKLAAIK